jgi:hypothetical protein
VLSEEDDESVDEELLLESLSSVELEESSLESSDGSAQLSAKV